MGAVSFMRPRLFLFGGAAVGAYRVPLIALRLMQLRRSTFGEARRRGGGDENSTTPQLHNSAINAQLRNSQKTTKVKKAELPNGKSNSVFLAWKS
jgi:hypothetical protein